MYKPFGRDDDSIMHQLLHNMDIDSAAMRLRRIGFTQIAISAGSHHLFSRPKGNGIEALDITLKNHHLIISWEYEGQLAQYDDVITSWEQWVDFVRTLHFRHIIREPQHNVEEDTKPAVQVLSNQQ